MRSQNWNLCNHDQVEDKQALPFKIQLRAKAHKPKKTSLKIIRFNFIKECEIGVGGGIVVGEKVHERVKSILVCLHGALDILLNGDLWP